MSSTASAFVRPPLPQLPSGQHTISTTSPISTPSFTASSMSFSILTRTEINAPPHLVAGVILNSSEWWRWNTFIPRCDVVPSPSSPTVQATSGDPPRLLRVGDQMTFRVNMKGTPLCELDEAAVDKLMKRGQVVQSIEPLDRMNENGRKGFRIVWKSTNTVGGLLRAERVQEIVETPDGGCEYLTWETFGLQVVMTLFFRLGPGTQQMKRFAELGNDLKERAEILHSEEYGWNQRLAGQEKVYVTEDDHGTWAFVNHDGTLRYGGVEDRSKIVA